MKLSDGLVDVLSASQSFYLSKNICEGQTHFLNSEILDWCCQIFGWNPFKQKEY